MASHLPTDQARGGLSLELSAALDLKAGDRDAASAKLPEIIELGVHRLSSAGVRHSLHGCFSPEPGRLLSLPGITAMC